ncbi:MAG: amino acid adenylation domain-containing protein, partial [Gammaproteobacteria bacterium]
MINDESISQLRRDALLKLLQQNHGAGTAKVARPPILPINRGQPLPLSFAQQRLWFLAELDSAASAAYHMPAGLRLEGTLDRAALRATFDRLVARHEVLRTTFVENDGEPLQVIASPEIGFALSEHDLPGLSETAQSCAVAERSQAEATQPFDLATGPLIRGQLLQLADDQHILLVTQHHIISDGWSIGILIQEVSALYSAFSRGQPDPLAPLAIQYADYAVWQRRWLDDEVMQRQADFWCKHLSGAPALLELPIDRPRPPVQSYAGASVPFAPSAELSTALLDLSQRHGTTLFMTLLAGWSVLLARLSGHNDLVIGTLVANRQRAEIESLLGFFLNTLALRIALDGDLSVAQLLQRIKAITLAAYAHQDIPFEEVIDVIQPPRSLSRSPIFQVMLVLQNLPHRGEHRLPDLRLAPVASHQATTHFDVELFLTDRGGRITGTLNYASDLFDPATVERMIKYFQTLLTSMVQDEQRAVSRLPLLDATTRQQLLLEFNDTAADYPRDRMAHQLFEARAQAQPQAIAVVYAEQSLSYGELNCRANQLAHQLRALGINPDDRVAICVERSVEMVVGLLGILKAGGAYVPLDPRYPQERLAYMLNDSAPVALLAQAELQARLPGTDVPQIVLALDAQGQWQEPTLARQPDSNTDADCVGLTPGHLAFVIYTSGSTGLPKGVANTHSGLANRLTWYCQTSVDAAPITAFKTTIGFSDSQLEILGTLIGGGRVVVFDHETASDLNLFTECLKHHQVSNLVVVPSLLDRLLEFDLQASALASLKTLACGGERVAAELILKVQAAYPRVRCFNLYGASEVNSDVTALAYGAGSDALQSGRSSIGRPIANTRAYILDKQREPVPLGVSGEIYIGGAGVARGYLNRPELTAERFVADPFSCDPVARLYRTGDLGRWIPDGIIEYLGRNDFQVQVRGFRIELGEIEARLAAHGQVREAVVIAREDSPGDKRLVAYVTQPESVGGQDIAPDAEETSAVIAALREHVLMQLPEYMAPAAFMVLDALPLTPNGKLDRQALPAPDHSAVVTRAYEPPQGTIETAVAEIWQDLLHLDQVGRHDHFFELGGHSLLATQLVSRVRQVLGVEVALRELFAQPRLAALAKTVGQANQTVLPPIELADRSQALPLSFAQQRLWFLAELDPAASAAYHMPAGLRLTGTLDHVALRATLDRLVARHEVLRTTFVKTDAEPVQIIALPGSGFALREHDLRGLADVGQSAVVAQHSQAEA